jgi:pilus assembly protein CpaC
MTKPYYPIAFTTRGKIMKSSLIKTMLTAACALAPLAMTSTGPVSAQTVTRPAQDISLSIGNGRLITVPGSLVDVFTSNDAVADVQARSTNQFYVFGKGGGTATVIASNAQGDVLWSANVRVGSNLDSVDSMLRLAMPEAQIAVSTMGESTFLLTGTVKAPEDAAEAERLVQAFAGNEANVISRLKMATPLQVNLQVRIAEVSRSLVRDIGMNLTSMDSTSGFQFGIGRGRPGWVAKHYVGPGQTLGMGNSVTVQIPDINEPGKFVDVETSGINPLENGTTLGFAKKRFGIDLLGALDLGEQVGLVTTLSQPNLTALSGETAEFLAGGEFPIPLSEGLGSTSIEYKKYGVSLAYTPVVLSNGRISMRVRPEVSELSTQGAIVLNGFQVPALTVRRAETTVELGSGQSFMIAGLMNNNALNSLEKAPGIGDIPIIGALFRSTNYRKGETELVIVVTPYLVNPVNAADIKLPTDGFNTPNELQRLFGNLESSGKSGQQRPGPKSAVESDNANPTLGMAGSDTSSDRKRRKKKNRKADSLANSNAPAPGFNLK